MIWESSAGHKKATFKIPSKRFIDVTKNAKKKSVTQIQTKKPKPAVPKQQKNPPLQHQDGMF